jgi:predicted Zn-dependent peptidase
MCDRKHADFHTTDLISDLLSNGKSSRLYNKLVKEQNVFSEINAYITGDIDEGLFVITGRLYEKTSFKVAESTIKEELDQIKNKSFDDYELEKVKNQFESNYKFGEVNPLEKAMNLAFHELLGNAEDINHEVEKYREVTQAKIKEVASTLFSDNNCSTLFYKARK